MNDAITQWKLMSFAHTKNFEFGFDERFITSSKDLMIIPNSPRFVRLGDKIWFTARVINLSDQLITYESDLQLVDDLREKGLIILH